MVFITIQYSDKMAIEYILKYTNRDYEYRDSDDTFLVKGLQLNEVREKVNEIAEIINEGDITGAGVTGPAGEAGSTGAAGATGPAGATGAAGVTGAAGATGDNALRSAPGAEAGAGGIAAGV